MQQLPYYPFITRGGPVKRKLTYDAVVYTEDGHYFAEDADGHIFCQDSPTACIQEAINALPTMTYIPSSGVTVTAPVGKIVIRGGTYNINQTITIPAGSIISIVGESAGAAVQWGGYNATVINYNSGSSGNNLLTATAGNYSYPYTKLWLENLTFFFSGTANNAFALHLHAHTAVLRGIQVNCNNGGVSGISLSGSDMEDTYELDNVQVAWCYYGVYAYQGFGDFNNFETFSNYYGLYVDWQGMFKVGGIHSYHSFGNFIDIYITGSGMPIYIDNIMIERSSVPSSPVVVTNGRRLIIGDLTFTPSNWNVITSAFDNFSNVTLLSNGAYSYNNTVLLVRNNGTATFSGNDSTTQFTIAHGLATTPNKYFVTPCSANASGGFYVTADSNNLYVNYNTAPPSGTNNVVLCWYAEV